MRVSKEELLGRWDVLAQELMEAADHLFEVTDLGDESDPLHAVRISALSVMCRSTNQFAALRLLMVNGFIVEARTVTRCCYENLFWLGGLKEKGLEFLKQMEAAHTQSSRALSKDLLKWWRSKEGFQDTSKKLEAFIDSMKNKPSGKINAEQEAKGAGLDAAYVMYRALSNDAAHPSAKSLSRHVREDVDAGVTVCGDPQWEDAEEDLDTWDLGCGVLLMVCIATNEILKSEKNIKLSSVYETFASLRALTYAFCQEARSLRAERECCRASENH
jgi:Family of unknown function (DUF5677)